MEIYLIRHGESTSNRDYIIQGHFDAPLSELGRKQAKRLGEILPKFDKVYSSPLRRALETAVISSKKKDPEIVTCDELKEIYFGEFEGKNGRDIDNFNIDQFRLFAKFLEDSYQGNYGIETHTQFHTRVHNQFSEIIKECQQNGFDKIAIFSHGGVIRSIMQFQLLLESHDDAFFKNTEVVVLKKNGTTWRHRRLKDHIQTRK